MTPATPIERYESARLRGVEATTSGDLPRALACFAEALEAARETGDGERVDHAFCNWAEPAIELGQMDEPLRQLRLLLLRSTDTENRYRASYHVARAHELKKEYKKALFYARAAKGCADDLARAEWQAASHNQLGNLLLAESRAEEARELYAEALERMPRQSPVWRARVLDNLGYCEILAGRMRRGFELLFESLRAIRRAGAPLFEISTRLDLCFAYMEAGRFARAIRHGEIALRLSEELGDDESVKNALYLLGEAANLANDPNTARARFTRLQKTFFPENPFIPDFLLSVDVRRLINLKA